MRQTEQPGLIVRQKAPLNLEFQFASLSDWCVPVEQFYVRNHFALPEIQADTWRLHITGAVEQELEFSIEELLRMPPVTLAATLECAGNGRVYYEPVREGLQWQNGAVGNASWTGVLLRDLLVQAGLKDSAVDVVLVGADRGVVDGGKKTASPGPIAFSRSIPVAKAMSDSSILAYAMIGETLTTEHGYPLRGVVGGWYGMAWVKWIIEIRVVERSFMGYWQSRDYFRWERDLGEPTLVPLTKLDVKSQIARPTNGAIVAQGRPLRVFGAAWGGEAEIVEVNVSVEGGANWQMATLLSPPDAYGWRFWEYYWTPTKPGRYEIQSRAIDAVGNVQPSTQQPDRESYGANWSVPVEVRVVATPETYADEFVI